MKLLTFDEAFKPTPDDIGRGDGYLKVHVHPVDYPQFGLTHLLNPINNITEFMTVQRAKFVQKFMNPKSEQSKARVEFLHVRKLFSGKDGRSVCIVRQEDNGIYYAKKTFAKHNLVTSKKVNQFRNMKRILNSIRFPFTLHLNYFYKDNTYIHYVLPLMAGGSLYHYLVKNRRLHERFARFISSQILLAIEFLHFIGFIYRDLKLENILIDHYGYIKLSNFEMCKLIEHDRTYTICGTIEYMAPEVITQKGYGLAADWWSFGVLIYELCNGLTPFFANETIQIFTLIAHCDYAMPVHFSTNLRNLIENLLQPDLTKRLGNLKNGVDDIKHHNWFREVPWLAIINRRIISPMIPFISDENNKTFFDITPEPSVILDKTDVFTADFANF